MFKWVFFFKFQLVIQAAVRVKDFTPTDETITLKVSTLDNSDSPYEEKITFKVADFDSDLVDLTKINATDLKVSTYFWGFSFWTRSFYINIFWQKLLINGTFFANLLLCVRTIHWFIHSLGKFNYLILYPCPTGQYPRI